MLTTFVGFISFSAIERLLNRTDKADDVNRIVKYVLTLSTEEKNYLLTKDPKYVSSVNRMISNINMQIGETLSQFSTIANQMLIQRFKLSVGIYAHGFEKFIAIDKNAVSLRQTMEKTAQQLQKVLSGFTEQQQQQLLAGTVAQSNDALVDELQEADLAKMLLRILLEMRYQEKKIIMGDRTALDKYTHLAGSFNELTGKLQEVIERPNSLLNLQKVTGWFAQYNNAFHDFLSGLKKQEKLLTKLEGHANNMKRIATDLRDDQRYELQNEASLSVSVIVLNSIGAVFLSLLLVTMMIRRFDTGIRSLHKLIYRLNQGESLATEEFPEKTDDELGQVADTLIRLDSYLREVTLSRDQLNHVLDHMGSFRFVINQDNMISHLSIDLMNAIGGSENEVIEQLRIKFDFVVFRELIRNHCLCNSQLELLDVLGRRITFQFAGIYLDNNHLLLIGRPGSYLKNDWNCCFNPVPSPLALLDNEGRFLLTNEIFQNLMGVQKISLSQITILELAKQQYCNLLLDTTRLEILGADSNPVEIIINPNRLDSKRYAYLKVLIIPENRKGVRYALSLTDISHIRHSEERIHQLAYYDSLTSLPNRPYLLEEIEKRIAQARRHKSCFALLFLDLDDFKQVNDSLGHITGDELLQQVAKKLKSIGREGDFIGRLGGDEFCIVTATITNENEPGFLAQRLLEVLAEEIELNKNMISIRPSCSIGIAIFPGDGDETMLLLQGADNAMYAAKAAGKNSFCYYNTEMTQNARRNLQLSHELRIALQKKQFEIHWQPIVNVDRGRVATLEALIRWRHPKRGLIPPDHFIPTIERLGMATEVGRWVMQHACEQWVTWQRMGVGEVRIAVNISATQFEEPDFVEQVAQCIKVTGMDASSLEIEITESMTRDIDRHVKACQALELIGVRISVDDFGTGYSSLSMLGKLGLNWLKIDRQFVDHLLQDMRHQEIVTAIIKIAKTLEIGVIAEGVETCEQAEKLHTLGCHFHQGYWFSRPVPADEVPALICAQYPSFEHRR